MRRNDDGKSFDVHSSVHVAIALIVSVIFLEQKSIDVSASASDTYLAVGSTVLFFATSVEEDADWPTFCIQKHIRIVGISSSVVD